MQWLDELGIPKPERIVFEHPPLVMALCQVRYSPVLGVADPKYVAPFQRAIQHDYPILTSTTKVEVGIELRPDGSVEERTQTPQWLFTDKNQEWNIALSQDAIAMESRRYTHFQDFITRLRRLLVALVTHIQPAIVQRVGLRYIDEIRVSDYEPYHAIRSEILGTLAVPALAKCTTVSIQETRLHFPEDRMITIRHGLLPDGSTVRPRSGGKMPTGKFYLLDIDVFQNFALPTVFPVEPETICEYVNEYHEVNARLFRHWVTDEYTSSLEVRQDVN